MHKLMLISVLLLASASAQAGPSRGLALATADDKGATETNTAQPLPPVTQDDAPKPPVTNTARPHPSRPHPEARRFESDEAKARRIAARYGISW
jgi:hypothetical protein